MHNVQAAIWRRCLEAKPNVLSPSKHGCTEEDSKLNILSIPLDAFSTITRGGVGATGLHLFTGLQAA